MTRTPSFAPLPSIPPLIVRAPASVRDVVVIRAEGRRPSLPLVSDTAGRGGLTPPADLLRYLQEQY